MKKDEETEIAVECSVLDIGFLLDIGRSMFDVRCSTFIFQNNLKLMSLNL